MTTQYDAPPAMTIDLSKLYPATIETSAGSITVELYPAHAPQTVNNFVFLARDGFYDGVIFHRVISGFMIQGGDPTGTVGRQEDYTNSGHRAVSPPGLSGKQLGDPAADEVHPAFARSDDGNAVPARTVTHTCAVNSASAPVPGGQSTTT